jgi:lipoyl(octanoyl) transferase
MYELHVRNLGLQEYNSVFENMRDFTTARSSNTVDEFWCVQHPAVLTLGANADQKHILSQTDIPIVQSDRGGQVTYHAPGQVIIYLLVDLKRKSLGVKRLVQLIEGAVVELLKDYKIDAQAREEAHGVYVNNAKIASLGLRVHSGCSYHGVALNVGMDLSPFALINPCGFPGLEVTRLEDQGVKDGALVVSEKLTTKLCEHLEYNSSNIKIHDN